MHFRRVAFIHGYIVRVSRRETYPNRQAVFGYIVRRDMGSHDITWDALWNVEEDPPIRGYERNIQASFQHLGVLSGESVAHGPGGNVLDVAVTDHSGTARISTVASMPYWAPDRNRGLSSPTVEARASMRATIANGNKTTKIANSNLKK